MASSPVSGEEMAHTELLVNRAMRELVHQRKYDRFGPLPINIGALPESW